jgi:Glycosyltransferase family 87
LEAGAVTRASGDALNRNSSDPAISQPRAARLDSRKELRPSTDALFFTEKWVGLGAAGVALGYGLLLALRLARHDWWLNPDGKACTDFIWIWLSSKFAILGTLARAYDYSVFAAARPAAGFPACILEHFDYPPTLLFFTYPVGLMPYAIAFATWMAATLLLYLLAIYTILRHRTALIATLAFSPTFFNVLMGHNGFLSAGLFGLGLAFMDRRPWLSGVFVGLLMYKPQLGILFPFALLASRNWRVLFAAAGIGLIFAVAATIVFNYQIWLIFFSALAARASSVGEAPRQAFTFALVSVFGIVRTAGAGAEASWIAQFAMTAFIALVVYAVWARPAPYSLKAASLAIGSLLASPHVYIYDYCVLAIGAAFFVKGGMAHGFLPCERGVLVGCWAALFLFVTGPPPAMVCVVLLFLVIRRVVRWRGSAATAVLAAAAT